MLGVTIESNEGEEWRGLLDEDTLIKLCELADELSDKAVKDGKK